MPSLTLLDSLTLPGSDDHPNEDAFGHAGNAAFVIDGATCLGPNIITGTVGSDAAWLAEFCRVHFLELLKDGAPTFDMVQLTNGFAGELVSFARRQGTFERWQDPVAAFLMARLEGSRLELSGFADCVAFIAAPDGTVQRISPFADHNAHEMELARAAIARSGGLKDGELSGGDIEARDFQRALRATYNTVGGPLWTLGCVADAAHHMFVEHVTVAPGTVGFLCSDGFAALVDKYHVMDAATLIARARADGLAALGDELRHIERSIDPGGHLHPRMKVSDDATAVLFGVG